MDNLLISLIALLVVGYIYKRYLQHNKTRGRLPFPPGPKPTLLVGNASDIPTQKPWLVYAKWAEIYRSDILHAEAFGKHIIILNSLEAATDLMERRASNYSSRPSLPMLEFALLPYGDLWRHHRRIFQQSFRKDAAASYEPIQMGKVRQMLGDLLESPDDFRMHIRTMAAATIMAIVYGHNVSSMDDKYVTIAEKAVDGAVKAILPGATIVNTIPVLRYIPSWFPGVNFHQVASEVRQWTYQLQNTGFELVRKNMTVSAVATFFYAMAANPDVQRKAQNEIDAVIGNVRLPGSGDRPSLPYVEALFREVMRWRPVLPMGLPHTTTKDDIYKGFFIPKGSIVFANIWAMNHNENFYKDSDVFRPERYFDDQGELNNDDAVLAFGFGRRVCVGRHLATSTVWFIITGILATLNIEKAKDSQGNDIEIEENYTDSAISHPCPFQCSITPRSSASRDLIVSDA
ncbi:cytochrome P450 [Infundibulicybe gibba]|nr:cytochrome P450 [Infundibulicybe gibba]